MSVTENALAEPWAPPRRVSRGRRAWRRFTSSKLSLPSLVWLFIIAVVSVFGRWLAPHSIAPNFLVSSQPPSWAYPFGTNSLGQDLFSQVIYGVQFTMAVAAGATALSFIIGTVIGLISGMSKSWVDEILMRFTDVQFAFPTFVFAMLIVNAVSGATWGFILGLGLVQWAGFARLIRATVLSLREGELVESGRAIGASPMFIAMRYVFPQAVSGVLVFAAFTMVNIIQTEATISLMGFGPRPPAIDFGRLITLGSSYVLGYPWLLAWPVVVLISILVALVGVGEGLQAMLNPKGGR